MLYEEMEKRLDVARDLANIHTNSVTYSNLKGHAVLGIPVGLLILIVLAVIIDQFQRNLQAEMALRARNESK